MQIPMEVQFIITFLQIQQEVHNIGKFGEVLLLILWLYQLVAQKECV